MENKTSLDYFEENVADEYVIPESTPMRDFYRGKKVFLTGGTGFLGLLFVEKLLRSGVERLYLLMRPKHGKSPKERLEELYCGALYCKLEKIDPNFHDRITIIEGDMMNPGLGISDDDTKMLIDNIEIIIHAAADVRFDQILTKLIFMNVRGTRDVLQLAEKMKKLKVFSYISTAYSHCSRFNISEKFYNPPANPEDAIKFAEKYESQQTLLDILTPRIIYPWPNSYTFSKSLSEEIVRSYKDKFPICVIRPTIVIATHEDPIPAWCNNIYGLNGILVACGMGVLRILPFNKNIVGDIVCADFVINSTLAAIWYTDTNESKNSSSKLLNKDPEIYHVSSYKDSPSTWGEINDRMKETFAASPAMRMLWKHSPNTTTCPFMFKLLTVYYHVIPAIFFDMYLSITKHERRLMPVYRKVQRFMTVLKHFMNHEWHFTNSNMRHLLDTMTKDDQEFFPSDVRRYNFSDYCFNYNHGLKLYIALEPVSDVDKARKRYRKLCLLHATALFFYYSIHAVLFYALFNYMGLFDYMQSKIHNAAEFFRYPDV